MLKKIGKSALGVLLSVLMLFGFPSHSHSASLEKTITIEFTIGKEEKTTTLTYFELEKLLSEALEKSNVSEKSGTVTLLLNVFLGYLGAHRFYAGKIATGLLWFLTGGLFGIGWVVDFISIVTENFKDAQGKQIKF